MAHRADTSGINRLDARNDRAMDTHGVLLGESRDGVVWGGWGEGVVQPRKIHRTRQWLGGGSGIEIGEGEELMMKGWSLNRRISVGDPLLMNV